MTKLNTKSKKYILKNHSGYLSPKTKNEDLSKFLRLDLGENLLIDNNNVKDILKNLNCDTLQHYADPYGYKVKNTISTIEKCQIEEILLANSSDELISFLGSIFLDNQSVTTLVYPTFFRYLEVSEYNEANIEKVFTEEESKYQVTKEILEKIINKSNSKNSKLIWIPNPSNPTGNLMSVDYIEKIVQNTNSIVVVDEAFIDYCEDKEKYSAIKLINKYQNLIVLRTISKGLGLAGVRFAYLVSNKENIEKLTSLRSTLSMTSNLIQEIASISIQANDGFLESIRKTKFEREKILKEIKSLKNLIIGGESKTNIFLLRHKSKNLYEELKIRQILVADFSNVEGLENKNYCRITIGDKIANEKLISALKEID